MRKTLGLALLLAVFSCRSESNEKNTGPDYITPSKGSVSLSDETLESIKRGQKIYNNFCASCHLSSGEGIPNAFPPLNGSNWLTEKRKESIHAIKYGLRGPIRVNGESYNSLMADLGLEDREVADVLNYIFNSWDNSIKEPATVEEVAQVEE